MSADREQYPFEIAQEYCESPDWNSIVRIDLDSPEKDSAPEGVVEVCEQLKELGFNRCSIYVERGDFGEELIHYVTAGRTFTAEDYPFIAIEHGWGYGIGRPLGALSEGDPIQFDLGPEPIAELQPLLERLLEETTEMAQGLQSAQSS